MHRNFDADLISVASRLKQRRGKTRSYASRDAGRLQPGPDLSTSSMDECPIQRNGLAARIFSHIIDNILIRFAGRVHTSGSPLW